MAKKKQKLTLHEKEWQRKYKAKITAAVRAKRKKDFDETNLKQRKEFMRCLRDDGGTFGEAQKKAGLTFDQAMVVFGKNIVVTKRERLKTDDEVK